MCVCVRVRAWRRENVVGVAVGVRGRPRPQLRAGQHLPAAGLLALLVVLVRLVRAAQGAVLCLVGQGRGQRLHPVGESPAALQRHAAVPVQVGSPGDAAVRPAVRPAQRPQLPHLRRVLRLRHGTQALRRQRNLEARPAVPAPGEGRRRKAEDAAKSFERTS